MRYSNYRPKAQAALAIALLLFLLLFAIPALSKSYLIVNFTNQFNGLTPQWIGFYQRALPVEHEFGYEGRSPQTLPRSWQHPRLKTNPAVVKIHHGRNRLHHIDFTKHSEGNKDTIVFQGRYEARFKPNRVYYMGDITFTEEGISTKFSLETLRTLCKDNKIVRSAKAIYLVFQGPEPIKYDAPCAQLELLAAPAFEPTSTTE